MVAQCGRVGGGFARADPQAKLRNCESGGADEEVVDGASGGFVLVVRSVGSLESCDVGRRDLDHVVEDHLASLSRGIAWASSRSSCSGNVCAGGAGCCRIVIACNDEERANPGVRLPKVVMRGMADVAELFFGEPVVVYVHDGEGSVAVAGDFNSHDAPARRGRIGGEVNASLDLLEEGLAGEGEQAASSCPGRRRDEVVM